MIKKEQKNTLLNVSVLVILLFIFFYVLYIGASLLIPFIIALLFSFAIIGLSNFYKKFELVYFSFFKVFILFILSLLIIYITNVGFIFDLKLFFLTFTDSSLYYSVIGILAYFGIIGLGNHYNKPIISNFLSFSLSLATYIFLFWGIGKLIGSNIEDLIRLLPDYQSKVSIIITQLFEFFHLPEPSSISEILNKIDLQYIFTSVVGGFTSIFSSAGIIMFYVLFILLEYRHFKEKLRLMIANSVNKTQILETIEKIKRDVKTYFVIKTSVSLITSVFSYIIMNSFGLDFAIFWALLIFILNFIPSIGSIIAVLFPALFSLVQFDSYYTFIFLTGGLVSIQVLMGNIIEPKFMGNKLNLSPLVIIIALGFWGSIWGIIGMLLAVPIMVIINIILAKIPATRSLAILLSERGELQVDGGEEVIQTRRKIFKKVKDQFQTKKTKGIL